MISRCWGRGCCCLAVIVLSAFGSAGWLVEGAFLGSATKTYATSKPGKFALHTALQIRDGRNGTATIAAPFPTTETPARSSTSDLLLSVHVSDYNNHAAVVEDFNRNLNVLKTELEEKNWRFRSEVQSIQEESQQWDAYYRTKIEELGAKKSGKLKQTDPKKAQEFELVESTHLEQHDKSSHPEREESTLTIMDVSAADKVYWLAEQLHKFKFQAHQQEVEAELAAHNKLLQTKLEKLQEDLELQLQLNKFERDKNEELWQQRNDLQKEVASVQNELQQSIRELKERLDVEQRQRRLEKQRHQDQLAQQEADLQGQLRESREQAEAATEAFMQQASENQESTSEHVSAADHMRLLAVVQQKEKELADQTARTAAANQKANAQWASRMDLEKELSAVNHQYAQADGDFKRRFAALENAHVTELRASEQRLAQKESEAAETIRAATEESEASKAALKKRLKAKNAHYKQRIKELRQASEQEKQLFRESLESLSLELQQRKDEYDQRLVAEKTAYQAKQDQLISEVATREEELCVQTSLTATAEQISMVHWLRRDELEKELSALKYKHDSSILEWEERYKSLQRAFTSKQQTMEALLSQTKEQGRLEVLAAHREAEKRRLALDKSIEGKDAVHWRELQELPDSTDTKDQESNRATQSLTAELEQYKVDSERQLAAAREAAEAEKNELRALLSAKEKNYNEQVQLSMATNSARVDLTLTKELEEELSFLKLNLESNNAQWESRYNSLLESRNKALQDAEALLARRESEAHELIEGLSSELSALKTAYTESLKLDEMKSHQVEEVCASYQQFKLEARELIDKLTRDAEAAKTAYTESLRATDQEGLDSRVQSVHDNCNSRLREMEQEFQAVCDSHKLFQVEAHRNLEAEREAGLKKQEELRLQVQEKSMQLAGLLAMLAAHRSMESQQQLSTQRLRDDLGSELSSLQKKYEIDAEQWEARYSTLQKEAQEREEMAASDLWFRTKVEFDQKLLFVTQEAQIRQRELKAEIQAQAIRHSHDMEELAQVSHKKEEDQSQLHALTAKLNCVEEKAQAALEAEKAASLAKQVDLVSQVEQKQMQLIKVLELLAQERAKKG